MLVLMEATGNSKRNRSFLTSFLTLLFHRYILHRLNGVPQHSTTDRWPGRVAPAVHAKFQQRRIDATIISPVCVDDVSGTAALDGYGAAGRWSSLSWSAEHLEWVCPV